MPPEKIHLELIKFFKLVFKVLNFKQIKSCLEGLDRHIRKDYRESVYNSNLKNLAGTKIEFSRKLVGYIFVLLIKLQILLKTELDKLVRFSIKDDINYIVPKEILIDQNHPGAGILISYPAQK